MHHTVAGASRQIFNFIKFVEVCFTPSEKWMRIQGFDAISVDPCAEMAAFITKLACIFFDGH